MSTEITKAFINNDSRFDLAEKVLRALFPGAALIPRFADTAPRHPDTPRPQRPPLPETATDAEKAQEVKILALPPMERGAVVDEAVPTSVDLVFLPPPGLDFDSRHILFGLFEAAECVDTARAAAWDAILDEIEAYNASPACGALPASVIAVEMAIRATRDAASARTMYLAAMVYALVHDAPSAADVVELEEAAARLRITALSTLRTEEATLLAPVIDTRESLPVAAPPDAPPA